MNRLTLWSLPVLLILATLPGLGQSTNSGDIRGTVTDTTDALIPAVTVTVLNVNTGVARDYVTNQDGVYDTSSIVTGNYKVTFSKQGFATLVRGPITLEVGFTTVNARLEVGSSAEEVTVTSDVPLLQTETMEQSTTFEAKSMAELPQVTQDWENFVILLPGATGTPGGNQGSSNPGQEVAVNGNLPYSNILADGASTTLSHSQNANPATFETVAELQVSSSTFSAQYGTGGVIFNQITKSGTNSFHGSAYDYIQNSAFNAYPYEFGAAASTLPPIPFLRYNDFGASLGGPILKNKLFFYFDYDQIVNHGNSTATNSVPTTAILAGNFTGMQAIYDPTTQTIAHDAAGNPYPVRKSFASEYGNGNVIPAKLFDALALKMQAFYPTPTSHIAGGAFVPGNIGSEGELQNNFYSTVPAPNPWRKYFGRLDYDLTSNQRLSMSDNQADNPAYYPSNVTPSPIGWESGDVDNNSAQITHVWNISPRTINEARMGYTYQGNFFVDRSLDKGYAAQLGWQFAAADDIPAIQFINTYPYAWIDPGTNAVYKEHTFDPSDSVTMIRGKHILHFGGELLLFQNNSTAWGNVNAGTFQFSGQYTQQWAVNPQTGIAAPVPGTGMEYADFLLGYANNWTASVIPEYGARMKSPQMFIQDDWKLRPNLTLNLGLRYQINHGWNEVHEDMASFDPTVVNPATNTLGAYWYGSTHANGRTSLMKDVYNVWLPRVGAAWAVNPKTVLRGGFGVYSYIWSLDTYGGNNTVYGMGAALGSSGGYTDPTNGIIPATKLDGTGTIFGTSTPLPYTAVSTSPTRFNGQPAGYIEYHTPVPKIYQWNVATERQLGANYMVQLAYVASHGYNLQFPTDLNQVPESLFSSNDTGDRPYTNYQTITGSTNNAISNYNSLQASITKRMTNGLSFSFNYVWSHFLDDADSSGWGSHSGPQDFQNAYNPSANYSNSNFDVRNAFKGYAVYQLPFGNGKTFLNNNKLLDTVIGGWQISGTLVLSTGNPFSVDGTQNTYSLSSNASVFPNWNPGVSWRPAHQSIDNWFNPGVFLQAANGTFGNVRRNSLYGPGLNVVNLSAGKTFSLPWENMKFQIRGDAQNAFNHPSFGVPSDATVGGSSGVGTPYTTGTVAISNYTVGGRSLQVGARLTF
ncbi:MAG TPA: TonB-dependent receptor [Terriglobales bacterium]|nr:TonB-dependent receptor [Terriglobales bacterium]